MSKRKQSAKKSTVMKSDAVTNPTTNIEVGHQPMCIRKGFAGLATEIYDEWDEKSPLCDGSVVCEAGSQVIVNIPAYLPKFVAWQMRQPRRGDLPTHIFGFGTLKDAFSAFLVRNFKVPPVGDQLIVQPVMTKWQKSFCDQYKFIRADSVWIVYIPSPLGTGLVLKFSLPEIDNTTSTRGIIVKPQSMPVIALDVPFNSEVPIVKTDVGYPGQSGLAIKIENISDSSVTELNTPLDICVLCCIRNIECTGLKYLPDPSATNVALNFLPV